MGWRLRVGRIYHWDDVGYSYRHNVRYEIVPHGLSGDVFHRRRIDETTRSRVSRDRT